MLPRPLRVRSGRAITRIVRRGQRRQGRLLAVHRLVEDAEGPVRATVVVGRTVGPAVTRNRVRRQLRHLLRSRLATQPAGTALVVRATGAAGGTGSAELGAELDRLLRRMSP